MASRNATKRPTPKPAATGREAFSEGGRHLRTQDRRRLVDATRIREWFLDIPEKPEPDNPFGAKDPAPCRILGFYNSKEFVVVAAYENQRQAEDVFNSFCITVEIGQPYDFKQWPEPISPTADASIPSFPPALPRSDGDYDDPFANE